MEDKINGSVYHKFITNYQRPIVISKKDSKTIQKEINNKKNTSDTFHSKLIYVNKKTLNIPNNQIQNDISSDTKSLTTNSERMLTPHQNTQKSEKNGTKSLLNDNIRLNSLCNGLPVNPKIKRKTHQSVNNELNKLNSKSLTDEEVNANININSHNNLFKNENIKNKTNEYLNNTLKRLKKIQNNINNINTNGNFDSCNKLLNSYTTNKNEPKRKKNYSLNYNNDINSLNKNKSKEKKK